MGLLEHVKITGGRGSTGTIKAYESTFLDMQGWDGCLFILHPGTTRMSSSGTLILRECTGTSTAGAWATTMTNSVHWKDSTHPRGDIGAVDFYRPIRRYVQLATLTCSGTFVIPIQYRGSRLGSTEAKVNLQAWSTLKLGSS